MVASAEFVPQLSQLLPVVRYVDEDQAIIDAQFSLRASMPTRSRPVGPSIVDILLELDSEDGFHDEDQQTVHLDNLTGSARMQVVQPHRWWPAGMGDQSLYDLTISLLWRGRVIDKRTVTVGLTSVRCGANDKGQLLVNGKRYRAMDIFLIDATDESALLPVGGETLLIVRDHYGPDLLYQAADRAGLLLIQCVPIAPDGRPEQRVGEQVARLSAHPSLAGWCVGHLGDLSQTIAGRLRSLDPTHNVFLDVPADWAA